MVPGYLQLATVLVLSILGSSIAFIENSCEHNQFCGRRTDRLLRRFDDSERYSRLGDRHRYADRLEFEDQHREFYNFNHNDQLRDQSNRFDIEKVWREERRFNRHDGDRIHRKSFNVERDSRLIRERSQGSNAEKLESSIGRESIRDIERIQSAKRANIRTGRDERRMVGNFRKINKFDRSESTELKTEQSVQNHRRVKGNIRTEDRSIARIQSSERREGQYQNRIRRTESRRENFKRLNQRANIQMVERRHDFPTTDDRRNRETQSRQARIQTRENKENRIFSTTPRSSTEESLRRVGRREAGNLDRLNVETNRRRKISENRSRQVRIQSRENEENRVISTTLRRSIQEGFLFRRAERSAAREDENTERSNMKTNRRRAALEDSIHRQDRSRQIRTQIRESEENRVISTTPRRSIDLGLRWAGRREDRNTDRLNVETIRRHTSPYNRLRQERIQIRENEENRIIQTTPFKSIEERFRQAKRSAVREDENTERSDMKANRRRADLEDRRYREDQSRQVRNQNRENEEKRAISTTARRSIQERFRRAERSDMKTNRRGTDREDRRHREDRSRQIRENEESRIISTAPRQSIDESLPWVGRREKSALRENVNTNRLNMETIRRPSPYNRLRQERIHIRENEENLVISTIPRRSIEERFRRVERSAAREDGNAARLDVKTIRRRTVPEDRIYREDRSPQIRRQIRENEENRIFSTTAHRSNEESFRRVGRHEKLTVRDDFRRVDRNEESVIRDDGNTDRINMKTSRHRTDPEDRRFRQARLRQDRIETQEQSKLRQNSRTNRSGEDRRDHLTVQEVRSVIQRTDSTRNEQATRIQRQQSREFRNNFARNIQENSADLKLDKHFLQEYASAMIDNRPKSFQINEDGISYTKTPNDFSSLYQILQAILLGSIFLNMLKRQEMPGKKINKNWAFEKFAILGRRVKLF